MAPSPSSGASPTHGGEPSPARFALVFRGECLAGHDPAVVRERLAVALKLDEARAARLFSGERLVLRRDVDAATAFRRVARFAQMGARLHAEPMPAAAAGRTGAAQVSAGSVPRSQIAAAVPGPRPLAALLGADAGASSGEPPAPPEPPRPRRPWPKVPGWAVAGAALAVGGGGGVLLAPQLASLLWSAGAPTAPAIVVADASRTTSAPAAAATPDALQELPSPPGPPSTTPAAPGTGAAAAASPQFPSPAPAYTPAAPAPYTPPYAPPTTPPAAAAPAPGMAPPADLPPTLASVMSAPARRDWAVAYARASRHRAFAISDDGAHGWVVGAPSENQARAGALERCIRAGPASGGCRVIDADGELQE